MGNLTILEGVRTVQLTNGINTIIDESDYEIVSAYSWYFRPSSPAKSGRGYAGRSEMHLGVVSYTRLHRFLMNAPEELEVDHKNGDGRDNRRKNLRICTIAQNRQNMRKVYGQSKFKGVRFCKWNHLKPWRAQVYCGKAFHIGYFATEAEAARAYDTKARELFGEFAATNEEILGKEI